MSVEVTRDDELTAQAIIAVEFDNSHANFAAEVAELVAAHRRQAEEAMRERAATYVEGKGGVIPGATVFISLITGDRMPCMSGDGRDKLNPHKRRQFDDATRDLAAAIRGMEVE